MNSMVRLIVNADDLGLTKSCTHAIIEAFDKKLISSSTMCANGPYFREACSLCLDRGLEHHIGIHLNLTEGMPLSESIKGNSMFCESNGMFHGRINRLKPLGKRGGKDVFEELSAQIEKMRNHGLPITHADSHHHIHTGPFLAPVVVQVLKNHNISSIRIHRNIGDISIFKTIVKFLFNTYLRNKNFFTVNQFGGFEDIQFMKTMHQNTTMEMMVHPEYNIDGHLIDKTTSNLIEGGWKIENELITLGIHRMYSYLEMQEES